MSDVRYADYINSDEWRSFRARYFASGHQRRCAACGGSSRIDLHHRTYEHLGHEDFADVVPLCRSCHDNVHNAARQSHRSLDIETDRLILRRQRQFSKRVKLPDGIPSGPVLRRRKVRLVASAKKGAGQSRSRTSLATANHELLRIQETFHKRTRSASTAA